MKLLNFYWICINDNINKLDIQVRGGSDLKGEGLKVNNCKLELTGGSDAKLNEIINSIEANLNGGSDLCYKGKPRANINACKSCYVKIEE